MYNIVPVFCVLKKTGGNGPNYINVTTVLGSLQSSSFSLSLSSASSFFSLAE